MKNILCFGDSNTWGYDYTTYSGQTECAQRLPWDQRWPGMLQIKLGQGYRVVEEAMNGRTTMCDDPYFPGVNGMKAFKIALDSHAPLDLVIIHLGVNDLKHMFCLTAGMIAFGNGALIQEAKKSRYGYPAPQVMLIAPPPVRKNISDCIFGFSYGVDAYQKSCKFGKLYQSTAEQYDCAYLDCGKLDFRLNDLDGLHYAKEDHKKLAEAVLKKIKEIM
ncbi:MAG: GDSL-type esterase/lipase family protein [Lachnospiraceae bacterium]|nr:GDSL-type esterase/lipase family protein [Lachnospiraceae bacterium]